MPLPFIPTLDAPAEPQSDYDRVAAYQAAMRDYNAMQERIRLARLAFAKSCKPVGEVRWPVVKKTYNKAYYEGGFRMVIDGIPVRVAACVKAWKKSNRDALGQGYDPFGLTTRPHNQNGFTTPNTPAPYWERYHQIRPLESLLSDSECRDLINSGQYRKWRPSSGYNGSLFFKRQQYERQQQRERDRASLGPNLFQAARLARRLAKSKEITNGK